MYKTLALQPVSCRLQEDIQLEAHFLVGVQIETSKKKNKTKQKQTSTVVKLLVAESTVKVH